MTSKRLAWSMLALALAASAGAAETTPPAKPRQACAADLQRLCPDVTPGGGRIMQCLKGRMDQVSDGCKSAVMAQRAAHRARKAAEGQSAAPAPGSPPT